MTVTTHWSDIWLSADDWAEAFEAAQPGTAHNEARDHVWEELLTILRDKHDAEASADLIHTSLLQDRELLMTFNNAWPLLEAADVVADLWSVPAYLRDCAPWLSLDDVHTLQRGNAQATVVDDLIATDDSDMHVMSMLRGEDLQSTLIDETASSSTDPDLLAGPFAHIVVDEAQELTDAEWQMLLLRCPSRSFTIVGDRAQA
ncbi:MAG: AAA family ATPase, partial [Nocardioidaceae bacterium]